MTVNDIKKRCAEVFAADGKQFDLDVNINGRLKAVLGRCHYKAVLGVVYPVRIEISRQLLETGTPQDIDETIVHECAHALVTLDTGEKHGHDKLFKAKCQKHGIAGDRCAKGSRMDDEDLTIYKYVCSCQNCGKVIGCYYRAGKVIKNPSMYHSNCCGASILVEQNY